MGEGRWHVTTWRTELVDTNNAFEFLSDDDLQAPATILPLTIIVTFSFPLLTCFRPTGENLPDSEQCTNPTEPASFHYAHNNLQSVASFSGH